MVFGSFLNQNQISGSVLETVVDEEFLRKGFADFCLLLWFWLQLGGAFEGFRYQQSLKR